MTRSAAVRSVFWGFMLPVLLAAVLHQAFASNATTAPPTTSTTPTPTTSTAAPHTEPGRPARGKYHLTNSNGTTCLMANMGLQLNISYFHPTENKTLQEVVNINPNVTAATGSCEADSTVLRLAANEQTINLTFVFTLNTTANKYHLSEVSLNATLAGMKSPFSVQNSSLNYLGGHVGFSYVCGNEQVLAVGSSLSINTFQVQLQPFGVKGDRFGEAEECQQDVDDMLISIIVGAVLAGLVVIVLVAYLIGRRRSHAGYQTI